MNVKIILSAKKIIVEILACISENSKYLKTLVDISVIAYDEVISLIVILSTRKANNIATNMQ